MAVKAKWIWIDCGWMDKNVLAKVKCIRNTSHCLLVFVYICTIHRRVHRDQFSLIKTEKDARFFMWTYNNVASSLYSQSMHKINKFMFILKVRLPIWPHTHNECKKTIFWTEEAQTSAKWTECSNLRSNGWTKESVFSLDFRQCDCHFQIISLPSSYNITNHIPLQCRRRRIFRFSLPCYYFLSSVCTVSSFPAKVVQDYWDNIGKAKSERKHERHNLGFVISFFFELSLRDSVRTREKQQKRTRSVGCIESCRTHFFLERHVTIIVKVDTSYGESMQHI